MGKGKTQQQETDQVTRKLIGRWETSIQKWGKKRYNQFPTMHSLCSFKIMKRERETERRQSQTQLREKKEGKNLDAEPNGNHGFFCRLNY